MFAPMRVDVLGEVVRVRGTVRGTAWGDVAGEDGGEKEEEVRCVGRREFFETRRGCEFFFLFFLGFSTHSLPRVLFFFLFGGLRFRGLLYAVFFSSGAEEAIKTNSFKNKN